MAATRMIVMGVSGSGKTTIAKALAERLSIAFVEGDGLHPSGNIKKMSAGIPLTDDDRWPWFERIAQTLCKAENGMIVSCSALKKSYLDYLRTELG